MHLENLRDRSISNDTFRTVVATTKHTQVVIMSVGVGEDIGMEIHPNEDQVLYLVSGRGKVFLDGKEFDFMPGDVVVVPAGAKHNFTTDGNEPMKIITTYSPPHHPDGTIHKTKADAEAAELEHDAH